jgi:hypothetical protein
MFAEVDRWSHGDGLTRHQKARLLTFDRTLIDAMSLEKLFSENTAVAQLTSTSAANPTFAILRHDGFSRRENHHWKVRV